MKKVNKVIIVGVLTIGIGVGGYMTFAGNSDPIMTYKVSEVLEKQIENHQKFSGEVIPNGIETISFDQTKGTYELAVKKGDEVTKGQLLFKYNDPIARQGVTETEMQKRIAQKEVTLLQKQINVAKQKLQKDKTAGLPAEAVKASEIEIQQLESQLEMKKFEVEKAVEMIKVAKEKVNALSVTSPADGVIDDIVKISDEKSGMSGITLRHAGPFKVKGQLSEYELTNMKVGQEVTISSKTVSGKTWTGKVTEIGSTPIMNMDENKTVSNYPFTVTLDNSEGLQNGFHVYVTNKSGEGTGTVIPKSSILKKGDKTVVYVVKDGKAKEQAVTVEFETGSEAKVTGVKKGEQIISKPTVNLKDGMEVATQ
ncbi:MULTISPECIES: efflux RND transporter periplasmic adaptor subunit [Bacillus cereus group]|uniref:efflux RND transporter periplasmic adaptor subunit n=1 Tax=Bacillus cereus group TaxID=86661 RepID=UPI00123BC5D1|nr:efflux RND transporter periplasmic adaptor subunit [Bacillus cereus]KAA6461636.1 efflux RND transporter periplasmic adaptor subunit [Bacillus cereus]KAA6472343.1 efflux RND transporter periplasmic adaptor subunit [Bacillus cereus]KAB2414175.1 efflux RND transporter periplasmic adaptor subunit [Bacillus cereus]KAB2435092.1 efflux RND transporter periplasmic adaptor subunit [Bacillus cereus]KAB2463972.1 efflux RND transporter periplasmic adaptor subunit [Bacillus cereus]